MNHVLKIAIVLFSLILATSCAPNKGQRGDDGLNGAQGANGSNGQDGANGSDGQDAASVAVIQFCSEQVGGYSSNHFPEVGLCIGGRLLGVFWDNHNSFMAELLPGTYMSTSTGLNCTFIVGISCAITRP